MSADRYRSTIAMSEDVIEFRRPPVTLDELLSSFYGAEKKAPDTCPKCGSDEMAPVESGHAHMEELDRDGKIVYRVVPLRPIEWCCEGCGYRWPEKDPEDPEEAKQREAKRHAERIEHSLKTYARLTALAKEAPKYPSAFVDRVLKRTTRPGDRSYGVRFPWGRAIVEKTTKLIHEAGAPEFGVWIPEHWNNPPSDAAAREDETVAMALRHERRHGDGPYTAHARFRLYQQRRSDRG